MSKAQDILSGTLAALGGMMVFVSAKVYLGSYIEKFPVHFILLGGLLFAFHKQIAKKVIINE